MFVKEKQQQQQQTRDVDVLDRGPALVSFSQTALFGSLFSFGSRVGGSQSIHAGSHQFSGFSFQPWRMRRRRRDRGSSCRDGHHSPHVYYNPKTTALGTTLMILVGASFPMLSMPSSFRRECCNYDPPKRPRKPSTRRFVLYSHRRPCIER